MSNKEKEYLLFEIMSVSKGWSLEEVMEMYSTILELREGEK